MVTEAQLQKIFGPILVVLLALLLRLVLLPNETHDYTNFFHPWYEYIRLNGGFWALADDFSNYTPPYTYGMVLVSQLFPFLAPVAAIKLITLPFEALTAIGLYSLWRRLTVDPYFAKVMTLAFLFSPTLVLNGSYWGQSDIIYTTGLLACLGALVYRCPHLAMIAFGLAIAVKLQAAWLLPALLIWSWHGEIPWRAYGWIPAVYGVACLPAAIAGRPWSELITIYVNQANTFPNFNLNAANFYVWLPNEAFEQLYPITLIGAIAIVGVFIITFCLTPLSLEPKTLIRLALLSLLIVPFCLPKMHDRYFFAADVVSVLYSGLFPREFWVALAVNLISLFCYFPFLAGLIIVPLKFLAIALGAVIFWVLLQFNQAKKTGIDS